MQRRDQFSTSDLFVLQDLGEDLKIIQVHCYSRQQQLVSSVGKRTKGRVLHLFIITNNFVEKRPSTTRMGVQTRSQVAGHHEEEGQDVQSRLNPPGVGTSRAVATAVPFEKF